MTERKTNSIQISIASVGLALSFIIPQVTTAKPIVLEQSHCVSSGQKPSPLSHYLDAFEQELASKTGVYVLEQGAEAMMSRAWLTERAEKSIDIQYFIFSVDNVGLIATDYLVKAAERGVKVRVLVDDIMLEADGEELVFLAAHENIEIKVYNPNANLGKNIMQKLGNLVFDFHSFNQRMHNKVFVVDNQLAITGGRNIADEYFGFDHEFNFRDRDVFLAGKVVTNINQSFEEFWNYELSVPVEEIVSQKSNQEKPDYKPLHDYACDSENFHPEIQKEIANVPITFKQLYQDGKFLWLDNVEYLSDNPGKNDRSTFLGGGSPTQKRLAELAKSATETLYIQSPYLVTTEKDRALLKHLVDKGVSIKILTNSLASNDNLEAFSGYQRDREALLETGVEIYEFRPDAKIRQKVMTEHMYKKLKKTPIFTLHAKSMTIDGKIAVIGTYNFDPRSANLNTESITVVSSEAITQSMDKSFAEEIKPENAWQITKEFNPDDKEPLTKRLRVQIRRIVPKDIL
ncbi:phospholipase D family protein [Vibrio hyugaensis]|uniref:phospholipase D family protein n=1 Tax=Vibrio hyugaensis TaxID=1534743 RepID=UPI000CE4EF34|nr:phospholipase D family protein [Vibrio hyugaensis]